MTRGKTAKTTTTPPSVDTHSFSLDLFVSDVWIDVCMQTTWWLCVKQTHTHTCYLEREIIRNVSICFNFSFSNILYALKYFFCPFFSYIYYTYNIARGNIWKKITKRTNLSPSYFDRCVLCVWEWNRVYVELVDRKKRSVQNWSWCYWEENPWSQHWRYLRDFFGGHLVRSGTVYHS